MFSPSLNSQAASVGSTADKRASAAMGVFQSSRLRRPGIGAPPAHQRLRPVGTLLIVSRTSRPSIRILFGLTCMCSDLQTSGVGIANIRPTGARSLQMALGQKLRIIATEPRLIANGIANIAVLPTLSATQMATRVQPTFPSGRTAILPGRADSASPCGKETRNEAQVGLSRKLSGKPSYGFLYSKVCKATWPCLEKP
jgi:hypothetical protein